MHSKPIINSCGLVSFIIFYYFMRSLQLGTLLDLRGGPWSIVSPPECLLWLDPGDIRAGLMAKYFLKYRITKGQYPALKKS